ncbi:MAG: hypothetical protein ACNA8L_11460, partial [Luteolibacter sp.]
MPTRSAWRIPHLAIRGWRVSRQAVSGASRSGLLHPLPKSRKLHNPPVFVKSAASPRIRLAPSFRFGPNW